MQSVNERKRMTASNGDILCQAMAIHRRKQRLADRQATLEYVAFKSRPITDTLQLEATATECQATCDELHAIQYAAIALEEKTTREIHQASRVIESCQTERKPTLYGLGWSVLGDIIRIVTPKTAKSKRRKKLPKISSTFRKQLRDIATSFRCIIPQRCGLGWTIPATGIAKPCQLIREVLKRSARPNSRYTKNLWQADCLEVLSEAYVTLASHPEYCEMPLRYLAKIVCKQASKQRSQWIKFVSAETAYKLAKRTPIQFNPDPFNDDSRLHLKSNDRLEVLIEVLGKETVYAICENRTVEHAARQLKIHRSTLHRKLDKARQFVEMTKQPHEHKQRA